MIKSFKDKDVEEFFNGKPKRKFKPFERPAYRKLKYLNAANALDDLRVPPGNRLEALTGDRAGRFSIRVNDRYRICFVWRDGAAREVEIVDYH